MYKVTIGLEVHCELDSNSKVFSPSINGYTEAPNSHVACQDLGFPGILPIANKEAWKRALIVSMAMNCTTPDVMLFDRKNYYYPDLPKGYQITQMTKPVGINGAVDIEVDGQIKKVLIHDTHLEEDTASLDHYDTYSLIDYNRSCVPLLETVTEPCLHSKEEALAFLETYRSLIVYCGVSEARSDRGQMRCDVNVSISDTDKLGTKVEMKNINSFYNVGRAIDFEIERQSEILQNGGKVEQETRRFDDETGETFKMRDKADAVDYKYFIEPNIPPIKVTDELLDEIRKNIPMLRLERKQKYMNEFNLSEYDSEVLVKVKENSDFFNDCVSLGADPKKACNWVTGMLMGYLNENEIKLEEVPVKPEMIKELIDLIDKKTISSKQAKEVFEDMIESGKEPNIIVKEKGMMQITDDASIHDVVMEVLKENDEQEFNEIVSKENEVIENKTNENISSGKLKVVIGNKEIEKRLELLPIGKKAIFKIAVPNELKDTINKSKVTITLTEIKSSNNFSFIDVDKINNTKTNVSVIENDTNINISGINKTGKDLNALIGFVVLYNNNKIIGADNIRIENIKNNSKFESNVMIPKMMIPSSDLTPNKINYGKVNYDKIEVYYTFAY